MAIGHNYIAASFIGMNKSIHYIYRIKEKVIFYKKKTFSFFPVSFSLQLNSVLLSMWGVDMYFSVYLGHSFLLPSHI